MANPFVSEIRIVPFTFAPNGWAMCNGQIIAISQNTALFSLLGTNFGGDGKNNFGLPNMQGNVAMDMGSGVGLTQRPLGESGGSQSVTLNTTEIPGHTHAIQGEASGATSTTPANNMFAIPPAPPRRPAVDAYKSGALATPVVLGNFIGTAGGGQPHNNMQPYLVMNYVIALQGIFPARS